MSKLKYFIPLGIILGLLIAYKSETVQEYITEASAPEDEDTMPEDLNPWSRFDALFKKYGEQYSVDWKLLKAFALNESSLGAHPAVALGLTDPQNLNSVSEDGKSYGLMQFILPTARDYMPDITYVELNDPKIAIELGARHVAWLFKQFPNEPYDLLLRHVVISYNQGVGNTKKGKDYTGPYYDRFMRNYALVQKRDI